MPAPFFLPPVFIYKNTSERGVRGVEWLRELPAILEDCERRWSIAIGPPFDGLSYNYVAPAVRADGTRLVIKCFPSREFSAEADALRIYGGVGAVAMLEYDPELGVMLLERIEPGVMLSTLEDDAQATSIAASVMRQIRHPAPEGHRFPSVEEWAQGLVELRARYNGGTGPFPAYVVDKAERLYAELLPSQGVRVVLHGDLHHYNILSAERQPWLAIDPHGVVGEAEYEIGALIRNPVPQILFEPEPGRILKRRMDQLADELGFDRRRIYGWAMAQAVLSAWWTVEDSDGNVDDEFYRFLDFTEVLASLGDYFGW